MTFMRRPRAFLSYRHEELRGDSGAEQYNALHRTWVNDFAHALESWNVDVIWDDRLREWFRPLSPTDPSKVAFLAETSLLCLQVAQIFMPILTRGYMERVQGAGSGIGYGTVTEEWQQGVAECGADRAEMVTIVREWPIHGISSPPHPIAPLNAWDFRFVAANRDELEILCEGLHGVWVVERPQFDISFRDWISRYLKFCVSAFDLPWPGVEGWGCNFDRPRIFLEYSSNMARIAPINPNTKSGSDRDMEEFDKVYGSGTPKVQTRVAQLDSLNAVEELKVDEAAKMLVRRVSVAHINEHRKPFAFNERTPGGRASEGLYFGPTQRGFSYLHP